jgi:hypothetical protein
MDALWDFLTSWYFIWILLALLVILIGVFVLLRVMKKDED